MDQGTKIEGLDRGIERAVFLLREAGIETFASCDGGEGHPYSEPTIRFHGDHSEGYKAVAIALQHALPVTDLRRTWDILDGELVGPYWELVFLVPTNTGLSGAEL